MARNTRRDEGTAGSNSPTAVSKKSSVPDKLKGKRTAARRSGISGSRRAASHSLGQTSQGHNDLGEEDHPERRIYHRLNLQEIFFLSLLVGLTLIFFRILAPFYISILIASILAYFFRKPYFYLVQHWHWKPEWASLAVTMLVLVCITGPVLSIGTIVSVETAAMVKFFQKNHMVFQKQIIGSPLYHFLVQFEPIGTYLAGFEDWDLWQKLNAYFTTGLNRTAGILQKGFVNLAGAFFQFVVILYLTYFLLIDGKFLRERIRGLLPMSFNENNSMFEDIMKTTKATLLGTVLVGIIEGIFGAILFGVFGLPSPVLWGTVMAIFSMVPILGTNTVLIPVAVYLIASGQYLSGGVILFSGLVGITISQTIVKPKLVGDHSGIHPAIIVLSTLGGIAWLGIIGFLVGPAVAALFVSIWNRFGHKYRQDLLRWTANN